MRINEIEDWRVAQRTGILRQVASELRYHNIGQCLHMISGFDLTVNNTPGLEEFLNANKQVFIKLILTKLKNNSEYDSDLMLMNLMLIIGLLAKLTLTQINWPEIDVIKQSVNSQINKLLK